MKTRTSLTGLKKNGHSKTGRRAAGRRAGSYSKGAAKREEILAGLMAALAEGDLRNPSLRAISELLGVEAAHILYYFRSREELLQAVIERWDEEAMARLGSDEEGTLDFYCETIQRNIAIPGIVHLYLTFAAEAVDTQHPAHAFFRKRFERVTEVLAGAVRKEQKEGTIPRRVKPEVEARLLIALADGLQLQSLVNPKVNAGADLKAAVALLRA